MTKNKLNKAVEDKLALDEARTTSIKVIISTIYKLLNKSQRATLLMLPGVKDLLVNFGVDVE